MYFKQPSLMGKDGRARSAASARDAHGGLSLISTATLVSDTSPPLIM